MGKTLKGPNFSQNDLSVKKEKKKTKKNTPPKSIFFLSHFVNFFTLFSLIKWQYMNGCILDGRNLGLALYWLEIVLS